MSIKSDILLKELECLICNEIMYPPIKQCVTGHSMCNICYTKVRSCPTCRASLSNSRNFALESIQKQTEFPCRNDGCGVAAFGKSIMEHERFCKFGLVECPLALTSKCDWIGTYEELLTHADLSHETHPSSKNGDITHIKQFAIGNGITTHYQLFRVNEAIFKYYLYYEKVANGKVQWAVQYFGKQEEACKYSFILDIIDKKEEIKKLKVESNCEIYEAISFPRHCAASFSYDFLKLFCNEQKTLFFRFKIASSENITKTD